MTTPVQTFSFQMRWLLPLFYLCCSCITAASAQEAAEFRWQRTITAPQLETTSPVAFQLDEAFFAATRPDYPDVRLLNAAREYVGFTIRPRATTVTDSDLKYWQPKQTLATVGNDTGVRIEFELREDDPQPDGLRIQTPLRDFENQVKVEGSTDGQTWTALSEPALLFDYSQHVNARNVDVKFDSKSYRRFRVTITQPTANLDSQLLELKRKLMGTEENERIERLAIVRRPFRVDAIQFFQEIPKVEFRDLLKTPYDVLNLKVTPDQEHRRTFVTFQTNRTPITELTLQTNSQNFSRDVTIECRSDDSRNPQEWIKLISGRWTSLSVAAIAQEQLTIKFQETRSSEYRVTISNLESPPLKIDGMIAAGNSYQCVFLADSGQQLDLYYGSDEAKRGEYDVTALTAVTETRDTFPTAELSAPQEVNQLLSGSKTPWRFWNDPKTAVITIIALTALLGWALVSAGRRIEPPPQAS